MAMNHLCKKQGYGVFGWHGNVMLIAVKVKVTLKRPHQKLRSDLLYFTIISSLLLIYKYFSRKTDSRKQELIVLWSPFARIQAAVSLQRTSLVSLGFIQGIISFMFCASAFMHPLYYVLNGDMVLGKWIPKKGL